MPINREPFFDWQDMPTLITDTLKAHKTDYCYSNKILNQVIEKCNNEKVNFVYKTFLDRYGELDYYELHPVIFFNSDNFTPVLDCNYQVNCEELPKGIGCKINDYYYGISNKPVPVLSSKDSYKKQRYKKHQDEDEENYKD